MHCRRLQSSAHLHLLMGATSCYRVNAHCTQAGDLYDGEGQTSEAAKCRLKVSKDAK